MAIGCYTILKDHKKYDNYNRILPLFIFGITCISISTVVLYLKYNEVESHIFYSLFLLNKISLNWVFRGLVAWGYVFIVWWFFALIVVANNKLGQRSK